MKIKYSPQRDDTKITYGFSGETITATIGGALDTFNFGAIPDGKAESITSVLDPCPVLAAERVNGELIVTLLLTYGPNAPESVRFPADEVIV